MQECFIGFKGDLIKHNMQDYYGFKNIPQKVCPSGDQTNYAKRERNILAYKKNMPGLITLLYQIKKIF